MFSTAIVLGLVSSPATGAAFNTPLSVILAGLGVLAIGYVLAHVSHAASPGAGAVYEYLTHGAHPAVGIFTAGVFFVGTLFLGGGGIYLGLGILANGFWAEHIGNASNAARLVGVRLHRPGHRAGAELPGRADRRSARC